MAFFNLRISDTAYELIHSLCISSDVNLEYMAETQVKQILTN